MLDRHAAVAPLAATAGELSDRGRHQLSILNALLEAERQRKRADEAEREANSV